MKLKINKTIKVKNNKQIRIKKMLGVIIPIILLVIISIIVVLIVNSCDDDIEKIVTDVRNEVLDSIPDEVTEDIVFLEKSIKYEEISFEYDSTNKQVLSNTGKITRRLKDINVVINITIIIPNNEDVKIMKVVKVVKTVNSMEFIESELRTLFNETIVNSEISDGAILPISMIIDGNVVLLDYEKYAKNYLSTQEPSEVDILSIEIEKLSDKVIVHVQSHGSRIKCRIVVYIQYNGQTKPVSISVYTHE